MFSFIFFFVIFALLTGILLDTVGDELRDALLRLMDSFQGNSYEKQLREFHREKVRKIY
ncbi:MAG: hypothetical protein K2W82_12045 [Candidatus Obscuribacterales bacterium]|jgi:hypothetical protein|nr:hypothetical protein [Candidatus Obscuribacterales bacterium]